MMSRQLEQRRPGRRDALPIPIVKPVLQLLNARTQRRQAASELSTASCEDQCAEQDDII